MTDKVSVQMRVQDDKTGQWQALATVVDPRPDKLSYIVDIGGCEQLRLCHMPQPALLQREATMKVKAMCRLVLKGKGMGQKWELLLLLQVLS